MEGFILNSFMHICYRKMKLYFESSFGVGVLACSGFD